jgi:FkbM family methyltransferase
MFELRLLHCHYKNWLFMISSYAVGRRTFVSTLRSGDSIVVKGTLGMYDAIRLAELIETGWVVEKNVNSRVLVHSSSGLNFKCRVGSGDFGHLVEIFVRRSWPADVQGKVILDVGMANADSAVYFIEKGAKLVIGLEPHSESFELAKENILLNRMSGRIIPLELALSPKSGRMTAGLSPEGHYITSFNGVKSGEEASKTEVNGIGLEDLFRDLMLEKIDLIKMDCEGCEYEVIASIGNDTFAKIKEIVLEFHSKPSILVDKLLQNGFDVQIEESRRLLHAKRVNNSDNKSFKHSHRPEA